MSGLTTYSDPVRQEDLSGKKPKIFDKKAYWNVKRTEKNRTKKRKK